jgi:hypothetical protein
MSMNKIVMAFGVMVLLASAGIAENLPQIKPHLVECSGVKFTCNYDPNRTDVQACWNKTAGGNGRIVGFGADTGAAQDYAMMVADWRGFPQATVCVKTLVLPTS